MKGRKEGKPGNIKKSDKIDQNINKMLFYCVKIDIMSVNASNHIVCFLCLKQFNACYCFGF